MPEPVHGTPEWPEYGTFDCPSCGGEVQDNGGFSCGCCLTCGIFFHKMSRLRSKEDESAT